MVDAVSLLSTEIHQFQDLWPGKKELCAANHAAVSSGKDIHYFWVVSPTKSPKIMGLKGIHLPEALKGQGGLSCCPWCGKEGKNEGTIVNHHHTGHYLLGLVCERCLWYFITSSDMMQHHAQGCQPTHAHDDSPNNQGPDTRNGGDGNKSRWYHSQVGQSQICKAVKKAMASHVAGSNKSQKK